MSQIVLRLSLQLPAGTMVANTNMEKPSQLRTGATTVSASQEKLSAPKRPVMEVSHQMCKKQFSTAMLQVITASVKLLVELILEASVFSRSHLMECVTLTAPQKRQTMAKHGAQPR